MVGSASVTWDETSDLGHYREVRGYGMGHYLRALVVQVLEILLSVPGARERAENEASILQECFKKHSDKAKGLIY